MIVVSGSPCKYGHDGQRYRSGACVECSKQHSHKQKLDPDYKEKNRARRQEYFKKPGKLEAAEIRHARWRNSEKGKRTVRARHLVAAYGITIEQYEQMAASQGHVCAICGAEAERERSGLLSVDHDHDTGTVRDLLCDSCNIALGRLSDDPSLLEKAAVYLRRHGKV